MNKNRIYQFSSILSGRVIIYLLLIIAMCASYFLHHQKHSEMGNDVYDALFMEKWRTLNDEQKSKLDEKSNNALEEKLTKMVTEANSAVISKVEGLESKVQLGLGGLGLKLQELKLEQEAASDHEEGEEEMRNNILLNLLKLSSEFSKQKIANLIISEYIEPSSAEWMGPSQYFDSRDSDLGDAMEALQLLEDDPEPVPITDHDSLFVGSVGAAYNPEALKKAGITHIINLSRSSKCDVVDDIQYLCMRGIKSYSSFSSEDLDKAADFIDGGISGGGKVMSHCWYGKNRSVTVILAYLYLMKYEKMTAQAAQDLVMLTRPDAEAHFGVLETYSEYLKKRETNATLEAK